MMPIVKEHLLDLIKNYSVEFAKSKNKEGCGLITKNDGLIFCNNTHKNPEENFEYNPGIITGLSASDIVCVWHSHIKDTAPAHLSFVDLEASRGFGKCPDKFPYLVYHTIFDQWDYYDPDLANPYPFSSYYPKPSKLALSDDPTNWGYYAGMPFMWGRTDCFGLIRHYFIGVLGIDIGDFRRPPIENQDNFPSVGWISPWKGEENGFEIMPKGVDLRLHDVFEIAQSGGKEPNHIAVCVDAPRMQILHNPGIITSNLANVEFYGKHWQSRTVKHLRHKNLI